ncbi:MAG: hypothetical protein Q4G42_04635 [Neisseria sp.]|nr:hypothetical protein [Neisseria sp.]
MLNLRHFFLMCAVFAGSLHAAPDPAKPIVAQPAATAAMQQVAAQSKAERMAELKKIGNNANALSAIMAAELALQGGDIQSALGAYIYLFDKNPRPELAERGMQLALESGNLAIADDFYKNWQAIEPVPSFAQKHMAWERQIAIGDAAAALNDLAALLQEANDEQRSRLFLYTAQLALDNPAGAKSSVSMVHKQALRYADLPEAAVADTIYSALDKRDRDAVKALQRLATPDDNINPATLITLNLLSQSAPEVLERFFDQTNTAELPAVWQSLHIETLLRAERIDEAYALVLAQLDGSPNVELYTQAGYLSFLKKEPMETALAFFDKAYTHGNRKQQSRTALFAAMGSLQSNNAEIVKTWTDKIHDGDFDFDKNLLLALIASDQKQWDVLNRQLSILESLPEQKGLFFDASNIVRLRNDYVANALPPQEAERRLTRLLTEVQQTVPLDQEALSSLYYARGLLYADTLQQPLKAVADLEQYVRLNPDSAEAYNSLGYTLLSFPERVDEAMLWIEKAHKKMPESSAIKDSLGWGYYLQGKPKKALPYLQEAFAKLPEAEIAAHLGEVLWELGRKDEARAVWWQGWKKDAAQHTLVQTLKKYGIVFPAETTETAP